MLTSVLITEVDRLRALRPAWEGLLARSAMNEPTLHPAWMLPWWEVFGGGDERSLRTVAFYDGPRLVGLVPLVARPHVYRPGIPFRRLEMLGSGEAEADETCADYLGWLAEPAREADVASAFARALESGALGGWDELVISSMRGDSPLPLLLGEALEARGVRVSLAEWSTSPHVPLPKTWDEYLSALRQNKRAQLRKSLRAFEQWAGGPPVITRVASPGELAEGKRVLVELHQERWGGPGVFGSAKFRAFHDAAMPELLAAGMLDLGWMSVRGQAVAAFYSLCVDGRIQFYQSGRKLDIPDEVRAGVTMHAYLIRAAIESGMREYDFLAGASQYKMSLALATRPLVRLRAARPSVLEVTRRASERAIDEARRLRDQARRDPGALVPPRIKALVPERVKTFAESLASRGRVAEVERDSQEDRKGGRSAK